MNRFHRLLAVAVALIPISCGSGGGGGGASVVVTATLLSDPGQQGAVNNFAGTQSTTVLSCGDVEGSPPLGPLRFLVTFDLPAISGGRVTSAVLSLRQFAVVGAPYWDLGVVVVDHVDYGDGPPTSTDYLGGTLTSNIGTLSSGANLALMSLDVTAYVEADRVAGRTRSQFRVRFSPLEEDGDALDDTAAFEGATNNFGSGDVPRLQVVIGP